MVNLCTCFYENNKYYIMNWLRGGGDRCNIGDA